MMDAFNSIRNQIICQGGKHRDDYDPVITCSFSSQCRTVGTLKCSDSKLETLKSLLLFINYSDCTEMTFYTAGHLKIWAEPCLLLLVNFKVSWDPCSR